MDQQITAVIINRKEFKQKVINILQMNNKKKFNYINLLSIEIKWISSRFVCHCTYNCILLYSRIVNINEENQITIFNL